MKALATTMKHLAFAAMMICYGCQVAPERKPRDEVGLDDPLAIAVAYRDLSRAAQLLSEGYPVAGRSALENAPAYWAIVQEDLDALRLLIEFGLDVNHEWGFEGGNLLTNATQFGHLDKVRLLVESGASIARNADYGRSPLYAAIIYSRQDIEEYLREQGAELNEWDRAALQMLDIDVD